MPAFRPNLHEKSKLHAGFRGYGLETINRLVAGARNAPKPPSWFCRFGIASLARWRHEPKFRAWVRFPSPAPEIRKIHVDSAALTHQPSLDLRSKGGVLRPSCAQVLLIA